MFGNRPSTSPASFPSDESFLQRAVAAGRVSLNSSATAPDSPDDNARGRKAKRNSFGRISFGSTSGTRLSPTRESDGSELGSPVVSRPGSPDERSALLRNQHAHAYAHVGTSGVSEALVHPSGYGTNEEVVVDDDALVEVPVPDRDLAKMSVIKGETSILLSYLLPIAGTHFLEYSLLVVTVVSVGHIGTTELAAASLASMTSNVSSTSLLCPLTLTNQPHRIIKVVALSVIQGFCTAVSNVLGLIVRRARRFRAHLCLRGVPFAARHSLPPSLHLPPRAHITPRPSHILHPHAPHHPSNAHLLQLSPDPAPPAPGPGRRRRHRPVPQGALPRHARLRRLRVRAQVAPGAGTDDGTCHRSDVRRAAERAPELFPGVGASRRAQARVRGRAAGDGDEHERHVPRLAVVCHLLCAA
jgi:hypothetical protein